MIRAKVLHNSRCWRVCVGGRGSSFDGVATTGLADEARVPRFHAEGT